MAKRKIPRGEPPNSRQLFAEFTSTDEQAPADYGDAGCRIRVTKRIQFVLRHEMYSLDHHQTIHLFGQKGEYYRQVWIHLYDLPLGRQEYDDELASLQKRKCDFFLEGRVKFSPSFLKPMGADGFQAHHAFGIKDVGSRRRIVHCLEGTRRNVVMVYSKTGIDFQDSALFAHAAKHVTFTDTRIGPG